MPRTREERAALLGPRAQDKTLVEVLTEDDLRLARRELARLRSENAELRGQLAEKAREVVALKRSVAHLQVELNRRP